MRKFLWSLLLMISLMSSFLFFIANATASTEGADAIDLNNYPDILRNFKECAVNSYYDIHQSSIVAVSRYQVHVNRKSVSLVGRYATIKALGNFHGFDISALKIPISKGNETWEQYTLTINGRLVDVRRVLERDFGVTFEFRGTDDGPDVGDGPQLTYATSVNLSVGNVVSRLSLASYFEQQQQTFLECDLFKYRSSK